MIDDYARACAEVVTVLKALPENQYNKIPQKEIEYYIKNSDKDYKFAFDAKIPMDKQNISRTAYAILVTIYRDFFINDSQKNVLTEILNLNRVIKGKQ